MKDNNFRPGEFAVFKLIFILPLQVESILDANISVDAQLERLADLVSQLATSTSEVIESQELFLPGSINATNNIVDSVIDVLFNSLDEGSDNISNITDSLVSIGKV